MKNTDIRSYMEDNGITQKMLANKLGCAQGSVSYRLKKDLSEEEKEAIWEALRAIDAERSGEPADEQDYEEAFDEDTVPDEPEDVSSPTKFQIGDRVKIPAKSNKIGVVSDIWHSIAKDVLMYAVESEDDGHCGMYSESQLEPAPLPIDFHFEAHIDGNVAVVTMNATQGEKAWVYARGHAHIIHDGEVGMAQAVSYAARRMFETLDRKQSKQIYFK